MRSGGCLLVFLWALLCAPAWAVHRCAGEGGAVVFQDVPCPESATTVAEDIEAKKAAQAQESAARAARVEAESREWEARKKALGIKSRDEALAAARAACRRDIPEYPVIGMTEADFRACTHLGVFGAPVAVNETETAAGVTKQYVYRGRAGIRYVYTRNGVVSAIQR